MGAPIPAGADIAALPTISFSSLTARDPNELDKLLKACAGVGFFYLDLRGAASKNILQDWRSVLDFMELYFGQDLATKMLDDRKSDTHGYLQRRLIPCSGTVTLTETGMNLLALQLVLSRANWTSTKRSKSLGENCEIVIPNYPKL